MKSLAHILIFSLLISLVISNSALANITRYQTPFEQAQWSFQGNLFSCQIEHKIEGFGNIKLKALPGEKLSLVLSADWLNADGATSSIQVVSPSWKNNSDDVFAEAKLFWHGNVATGQQNINPFLEALEQGLAWQADIKPKHSSHYRVNSSPVNTKQVANKFRLCRYQLLPKPFSYVRSLALYFPSGSSEITADHEADLNAIVRYVQADPSITQILVDAHADSSGERLANLVLSKDRADEIASRLVELGISVKMIQARHHGARSPKVSNNTLSGRDTNRRVSVRLIKSPLNSVAVSPKEVNHDSE
ncbi:OmpA family protein [Shewanella sp. UCD-KL12]|uniref:MotY family protein n=1 Tax=Shewanella sp. UCD-KL12 TaxID=1917163 RepID=UPI000970C839|nr:OmpA family protein [Shewanella sp. UCD-KL12]